MRLMTSNMKRKHHLSNNEGQTAVEYVMLLGVVIVVMVSLTSIIKARMVPPGGQCVQGSQNLFCQIEAIVSPQSLRYFRVKR